jgi:hypothetical protein
MRERSWFKYYDTSRKVAGSIPDEVIGFFNWPNPSSRTMALGSTQRLTEMRTRNFLGGEGRPPRKADNLAAICETIVWKMWEPPCLRTLWASTASYMGSFIFYTFCNAVAVSMLRGKGSGTIKAGGTNGTQPVDLREYLWFLDPVKFAQYKFHSRSSTQLCIQYCRVSTYFYMKQYLKHSWKLHRTAPWWE